jgi:hypothetical protein
VELSLDDDDDVPILRVKRREATAPRAPVARTVRFGHLEVDGGLDAALVRRTLIRQRAVFERCYDAVLAGDPAIDGMTAVHAAIGVDGRVVTAGAGGFVEIERCVKRAMRTIAFPRSTGGTVDVAVVFSVRAP